MPHESKSFDPSVMLGSLVCIVALVASAIFFQQALDQQIAGIQAFISGYFDWFYVLSMSIFLVFVVYLMFSKFGDIRLGGVDSKPEFRTISWLAMLFSAGMGIGILFYSVAEPILHFSRPAPQFSSGNTFGAAHNAMGLTFFHWGFHPWACYALVGLALSYFCYRRGLPLSMRSTLYPLLGERIHGRLGDTVDALTIVSTLFGVSTSLGIGAMQVGAGLDHLYGTGNEPGLQVAIIGAITLLATLSLLSGLKRGIRMLSLLNVALALSLMLAVFLAGPTQFLLDAFVENIGVYLKTIPTNSFWTAAFSEEKQQWLSSWTVFYWAWWIAWSPFVGMFIARISKGRTVREFLMAVLVAPTLLTMVWMSVFGDTALYLQIFSGVDMASAIKDNVATAIYVLLEQLDMPAPILFLAMVCVVLFFVTSSDSASLVIDTIASGGSQNPARWQRVFWAVLEGAVAALLLHIGGLNALQLASITAALPFCVILWFICWGLLRERSAIQAGSAASPPSPVPN